VTQNRIRLQPDRNTFIVVISYNLTPSTEGFGYKWCPAIRWEDLVAKKGFTIKCPHTDPRESAFRFQAWVQTDVNDTVARFVRSGVSSGPSYPCSISENTPNFVLSFALRLSWKTYFPTIWSTESTTKMLIRIGIVSCGKAESCLFILWS
jgi:hypothetical protein